MILNNRSIPILDPNALNLKQKMTLIQGDNNEQSHKKFNHERMGIMA